MYFPLQISKMAKKTDQKRRRMRWKIRWADRNASLSMENNNLEQMNVSFPRILRSRIRIHRCYPHSDRIRHNVGDCLCIYCCDTWSHHRNNNLQKKLAKYRAIFLHFGDIFIYHGDDQLRWEPILVPANVKTRMPRMKSPIENRSWTFLAETRRNRN